MSDQLGDYMKRLEKQDERRAQKGLPLCARLDGRAFHTFTKGLPRPYDTRLSDLMTHVTRELVQQTNALLGYTQSDEISLVWYVPENSSQQYLFDGRYQKMVSVLAAMATGIFRDELSKGQIPEKMGTKPIFDCRLWQVPTLNDAYLMFKWRELDAIKNSISMAAQAHFSHSQLHKVGSEEKKRMLREVGSPWEAEPDFFRKGSYIKKVQVEVNLTADELSSIPEDHRPTGPVMRSVYLPVTFPNMTDIVDPVTMLFSEYYEDGSQIVDDSLATV